jgi:glutamyl-tRNA reductase
VALSELALVGLNHKLAPVEVRERLAFPEGEVAPFLEPLIQRSSLLGAVLLSTCNRVELYVDAPQGTPFEKIPAAILGARGLPEEFERYFYVHRGDEALRHLFRVACGLDSMILGEPQIFGQVKESYFLARNAGLLTTSLNLMFQKSFHVAKRVRTETGIGEGAVTISFAAFNLAKNIFESLVERNLLILGAGEMSRIVATHFVEAGVGRVYVANRTWDRAEEFARLFGAEAVPWEEFSESLPEVDVVISCTGAQRPILTREILHKAMRSRRWEPMLLIDIAVPRDIEPDASKIDGVYLYDIDDLQKVADEGMAERMRKAEAAEALMDSEVELYGRFLANQELSTLIAELVSWAGEVQESELQEVFRKLEGLADREQDLVRNAVRRVVHKILHPPITEVKRLVVEEEDERAVTHFQRFFLLSPPRRVEKTSAKEEP